MAQSWLITGGNEEEKMEACFAVWKDLFGERKFPRFDKYEIKDNPIKIAHIRDAEKFLRTKPVETAKVLLVFGAESMTLPAANAFLKTLEEPPGNNLIFLFSDQPYGLPETIVSRCQLARLGTKKKGRGLKGEEEWARQLIRLSFEERLAELSKFKITREDFLDKVKSQTEVWRDWWIEAEKNNNQRKWFRQGLTCWIAGEKMLAANVNLKLVEGWLALYLPKERKIWIPHG